MTRQKRYRVGDRAITHCGYGLYVQQRWVGVDDEGRGGWFTEREMTKDDVMKLGAGDHDDDCHNEPTSPCVTCAAADALMGFSGVPHKTVGSKGGTDK